MSNLGCATRCEGSSRSHTSNPYAVEVWDWWRLLHYALRRNYYGQRFKNRSITSNLEAKRTHEVEVVD